MFVRSPELLIFVVPIFALGWGEVSIARVNNINSHNYYPKICNGPLRCGTLDLEPNTLVYPLGDGVSYTLIN